MRFGAYDLIYFREWGSQDMCFRIVCFKAEFRYLYHNGNTPDPERKEDAIYIIQTLGVNRDTTTLTLGLTYTKP